MPCRVNRQRLWATRIMLEAGCHATSAFLTLTYSEDTCPKELEPGDLTIFLRELRRAVAPRKLRYYAAGEYGSKTGRPHFHIAVFGLSPLERSEVEAAWGKGFVHIGLLTPQSSRYLAKYITKKWIGDSKDPRHGDRRTEFSRMSLKPGIGAAAMEATIHAMLSEGGSRAVERSGDVPTHVRFEGARSPMGKYLRSRLREGIGWSKTAPVDVQSALSFERSRELPEEGDAKRRQSELKAKFIIDLQDQKRRLE